MLAIDIVTITKAPIHSLPLHAFSEAALIDPPIEAIQTRHLNIYILAQPHAVFVCLLLHKDWIYAASYIARLSRANTDF